MLMEEWDETVDLVLVGSGGGALCASLVLADAGKDVLVLEKTDKVGGSTAMSGGVMWIPNHPLQAAAGVEDSHEAGKAYLTALLNRPDEGKGATPERIDMYLRQGPQMVQFLIDKGMAFIRCDGWSDYNDELPGGCRRGRGLAAKVFDARRLGPWAHRLRRGASGMPIAGDDSHYMQLFRTTLRGFLRAQFYLLRRIRMRLTGADLVGSGAAVQGRMLEIALRAGARIETDAPVVELIKADDRVVGVIAERGGARIRIRAREGVLLNAGGFAHDVARRRKIHPILPDRDLSHTNPGDTGEVIDMAVGLGADTDNLDQAIWLASSWPPGREQPSMDYAGMGRPHMITVGRDGKRFTSEAGSYMQFGQDQLRTGAVPAYCIIESRGRERYFWAGSPPGVTPRAWVESGYMKRADTIEDLARQCGIDASGLKATVERFNAFARNGRDEDFGRGANGLSIWSGDPSNRPNPSLGAIEKPPFHAVEIWPGDVGTYGGLVADQFGRVLTEAGQPIPGLYATGVCTAGVTGTHYPGPGGSLGPSFVFGWVAAKHMLGQVPN